MSVGAGIFEPQAVLLISTELAKLLANTFALYIKTKNFHWHVRGSHFRDYHRMLDEQGEQIFEMTDALAERARKIGGTTIRSIGQIAKLQTIQDNDDESVEPRDMIAELHQDNRQLATDMRRVHEITSGLNDFATTSVLENWIEETEGRAWFLFETIGG
jgi:starvation-inducible DNA-binding protein